MFYRNREGYFDPTAGAALSRIERSVRPLVYVCSRYAGDVRRNILQARKYCRFVAGRHAIPLAPHLLYPQFLNDRNPDERELGLTFGEALMDKCDEVWIFSDGAYSPGMQSDYEHAMRKGLRVRYFTTGCRERGDALEGV